MHACAERPSSTAASRRTDWREPIWKARSRRESSRSDRLSRLRESRERGAVRAGGEARKKRGWSGRGLALVLAAGDPLQRAADRLVGLEDLRLAAAEPQAAHGAERDHLEQVDRRRL